MEAIFVLGNERDTCWDFELDTSGIRLFSANMGRKAAVSWSADYSHNHGRVIEVARLLTIAAKIQRAVNNGAPLAEVLEDMCIVPRGEA